MLKVYKRIPDETRLPVSVLKSISYNSTPSHSQSCQTQNEYEEFRDQVKTICDYQTQLSGVKPFEGAKHYTIEGKLATVDVKFENIANYDTKFQSKENSKLNSPLSSDLRFDFSINNFKLCDSNRMMYKPQPTDYIN